jgi:hypothetical protein
MTKWIKKYRVFLKYGVCALLSVAVLLFAVSYWAGYQLFHNFACDGWHEGMTRDEKIFDTLRFVNQQKSIVFESIDSQSGQAFRFNANQIPYENIQMILKSNPDCCKLFSKDTAFTEHPKEDIIGKDEGVVMLRYNGHYLGSDKIAHNAKTYQFMNYNSCKK